MNFPIRLHKIGVMRLFAHLVIEKRRIVEYKIEVEVLESIEMIEIEIK